MSKTTSVLTRYRRIIVVIVQLFLVVACSYTALSTRFDGNIPSETLAAWLTLLPWLVLIRALLFIPFRLYQGLWRYSSIWDLSQIVGGVISSSVTFYVWTRFVLGLVQLPRSFFIFDALLLICALGGIRLGRRVYREIGHPPNSKTVL